MSDPGAFSMFELFREEVRAHSATLNAGLIELEADPGNPQRIEPLMRAAHSIKGAARIVDIDAAVQLAHVMEDAFVTAQAGRILIAPIDIDLFLKGTDLLASLEKLREDSVAEWGTANRVEIESLKEALAALAKGTKVRKVEAAPQPAPGVAPRPVILIPDQPLPANDDFSMMDVFREELRTNATVLRDGLIELETGRFDARMIPPLVAAVRAIKGAAQIVNATGAAKLASALESPLTRAERVGGIDAPSIDLLWRAAAAFANAITADEDSLPKIFDDCPTELTEPQQPIPVPIIISSPIELDAAPAIPQAIVIDPSPTPHAELEAVVRVTAQSLNRLIGLAGESLVQSRWLQPFSLSLMTLRKQYDQIAELLNDLAQNLADGDQSQDVGSLLAEARAQTERCRQMMDQRVAEFEDHSARAEDLNTRLYREVIVSRMRPFSDGAHAFPRLVRDAARRLDKQIRFELRGETTEVDRDILEKLEAPLTHLLRNAVDHGIEPPAERVAADKPETGLIKIDAGHRAGMLALTVSDDGRGIDPNRLREKIIDN